MLMNGLVPLWSSSGLLTGLCMRSRIDSFPLHVCKCEMFVPRLLDAVKRRKRRSPKCCDIA